MRRTLDRIRDAWATWKLWRHNRKFFIQVAHETAAYFTNRGYRYESREHAYDTLINEPQGAFVMQELVDPEHRIPGADPFGRFARNLHGDSDA